MARPVDDDLSDRALAFGIVAGLVEDRDRQAVDRPRAIIIRPADKEWPRRRVGQRRKRNRRVEALCVVGRERLKLDRFDGRQFSLGNYALGQLDAGRRRPMWSEPDDERGYDDEHQCHSDQDRADGKRRGGFGR